jgi:NTE family protein
MPKHVAPRTTRRQRGLYAALVAAGLAAGAPAPGEERPTIGIAFSGGGAKGCAHIGVLRVLEELRIPVDYAAGTSMGSIIGGLYATGMSVDELEQVILTVDWADALTDKPSRDQLSFRRKNDDLRYLPDIEAGIGRGGFRMPTGLRSGQKLNYLLRRFTLPVRTVRDFDLLPIPFRAVATDIGTGQMVVLDRGDLARALRASMAIPTAFSAVPIDGRLLVDGGITNNVPVDVVRAMGADVVIAIDIGSPLTGAEEAGRSYLKILGQTLGMITRSNMAPRLAAADFVITPPVADYGTLEFAKGAAIIADGEAEARRYVDALRPYALSEEEYRAWKASRHREPDPIPVVAAVRFEGNRRVDSRALERQIRLEPGAPFSAEAASDDLGRLFGLGDFSSVDVELVDEGEGAAVVYRLEEKPWGPTYLRFGLGFESDLQGTNDLSLLAGINRTRINALGAEWRTDLQLGSDLFAQSGFYQPLSFTNGWFIEPYLRYERRFVPVFDDQVRVAELEVDRSLVRLDLGYLFGRYGEARLGIERGVLAADRESGVAPEELAGFLGRTIDRGGIGLGAVVDQLDNAKLPKHGGIATLEAYQALESLGAEEEYAKVQLRAAHYWTRDRHTGFGSIEGGVSPNSILPVYDRFALGGLFSLSGFETGELAGDNFGLLRAGYYYRLTRLFHVGGYVEAARVGNEPEDVIENPVLSLTALVVADTPAGPLYFGFAGAEEGRRTIYVQFGRLF